MKKVDLAVIRSYFGAGARVDSVCSSFYPKMSGFHMEGRFVFSSNTFNKWSILDVVTRKEILLGYKDSLKIPLYKALYKADFEKRYPVAQQQIAFAASLKPGINFMHRWDDNNLMVIFNLKDYGINGKDTFLFSTDVITRFDIESQKFTPYNIDNSVTKNFSLWDCHIINNRYYFEGSHKPDYLPALLEMKCDEATKTFSLIRDIPIKRPENYKALQVPDYYEDNTVISGGLCAFIFDNKLLRLDDGKQVTIPFDEPGRKVYNKYEIRDLQQDTANYYVLYAQDSVIHALRFSKKGKEKKDVVIKAVSRANYWQAYFFSARNRVIYKPEDKSCLLVKEIEW